MAMFSSCEDAIRQVKNNQNAMKRIFGAADQLKFMKHIRELPIVENKRRLSPIETDTLINRMYAKRRISMPELHSSP